VQTSPLSTTLFFAIEHSESPRIIISNISFRVLLRTIS
jgi:hypothetical protein